MTSRDQFSSLKVKLDGLASHIGVDSISLDQLIDAYKTIRADRMREDAERRAEYVRIRERVAEQTAAECKEYGWFSAERLRNMTLAELIALLRED